MVVQVIHDANISKNSIKEVKMRACPYSRKCSGCQLQNLTYAEQLKMKQVKLIRLLGRYCHVEEIIGMNNPLNYRNKAQSMFGFKNGKIISGIYQSTTCKIAEVDSCMLESEKSQQIVKTIKKLAIKHKIKVYDLETRTGFLRHVLIREGIKTGEIMVALVSANESFINKELFIKDLLNAHNDITTIVWNINPTSTPLFLGKKSEVLYGKGYIKDILCQLEFRISPASFYQVNPVQTEILYSLAKDYASLQGNETVLDAYCGTGTIGLTVAKETKKVIGVEINSDAIRDAKENAILNGINNIEFYNEDAEKYIYNLALKKEKIDVVITDPPRAGCSMNFLKSLIKLFPKKIVYISCNPETLANDLNVLVRAGYRVEKIQPVDMFPYTNHVESVVCLSREKADESEKESNMICEEKSAYKSWSNLKKQMNDLLCDSLKGKISYFYTSYHEVHNAYGRATIQYEKKEIVAFSWDRQYEQVQDIKEQYRKMDNVPSMFVDYEGSLNAYKTANIAATKEKWMPNCTLCETDFLNSITIYLKTDIATSLRSDNYLLRVFAYMDRRVGKRTLIKIKDDVEKLPDWVKQFYQIRCEADGIVFPPKRITDETVVLLTSK